MENIHVFKIDPKIFKFSIVTAKDFGEKDITAQAIAKKSKAILVINGGYFDEKQRSLGLLIRDGKTLNPIHPTDWWAVFQMKEGKSLIVPQNSFKADPNIEMALQAGPRLVVKGRVVKTLKASTPRRRSGLCIREDSHLIIAMSEAQKTMEEFAKFLQRKEKRGGLACSYALNLDGGRSSQIYINWNGFQLDIPSESRITNAIAVFPRGVPGTF